MSPAKMAKKSKEQALTIELSGISTLVWNRKSGTADVHLVDLASAGFERHYAGLSFEIAEDSPRTVKGPSADAAISVSGEEKDIGIWDLRGTTVEMVGATGKLTVDDSKVNVTKKPEKSARSIQWLANISFLTESRRLDPAAPTAAIVRIPAGHVTAGGGGGSRLIRFSDQDGHPIAPDRYCVPRFKVVIPFGRELAVRLSRERVLRFHESMKIMISNTCVCGLGVAPVANHFYGHYDVVEAKRRPKAERAGKLPLTPQWPELCIPAVVEI